MEKYHYGDRVKIISNKSKYCGRMATVARHVHNYYGTWVAVVPDDSIYYLNGDKSKYLRLRPESIKFISEGDMNMGKLTGFKRIAVIEQGDYCRKSYHYALYDDDIEIGDHVLVTGVASDKIYTIKDIIEVSNEESFNNITAEVMCKVDLTKYNNRKDKRKAATELRKQMDKKRKEIEAKKNDEYYASIDSEYAEMLSELKDLQSY